MERTLGPRNVGDILKETFTIYRKNFWRFAAIVLIAAIPNTIAIIVDLLFPSHGEIANRNAASFFIMLPLYLLTFVLSILTVGATTHAVAEQYFKQPINFGRAFSFSWNRLSDMFWASVLAVLAIWGITAGTTLISLFIAIFIFSRMSEAFLALIFIPVLLVAMVAAIYLGTRWAFAIPTALLEGHGPTKALSSSSSLVKQNWWRVLGILLLLGLILMAIALILVMPIVTGVIGAAAAGTELPTWLLAWAIVGTLIANIVCAPLFTIGETLLYFDLRVRKHGYSLDALANELGLTSAPVDTGSSPPV